MRKNHANAFPSRVSGLGYIWYVVDNLFGLAGNDNFFLCQAPLSGRVESWRGGRRIGESLLLAAFALCRCLCPSVAPFPVPATSYAAYGFFALRAPARFASRICRQSLVDFLATRWRLAACCRRVAACSRFRRGPVPCFFIVLQVRLFTASTQCEMRSRRHLRRPVRHAGEAAYTQLARGRLSSLPQAQWIEPVTGS